MESIKAYFEAWKSFDFFTQMSDDNSVYLRGKAEMRRLRELAGDDPILLDIHTRMCQYNSSLGQTPKPKLSDYIGETE